MTSLNGHLACKTTLYVPNGKIRYVNVNRLMLVYKMEELDLDLDVEIDNFEEELEDGSI